MASLEVKVQVKSGGAETVMRLIGEAYERGLIGERLAWRLASWAMWLVRCRVGSGKWKRLGPVKIQSREDYRRSVDATG